jgi:hypothetical protein
MSVVVGGFGLYVFFTEAPTQRATANSFRQRMAAVNGLGLNLGPRK